MRRILTTIIMAATLTLTATARELVNVDYGKIKQEVTANPEQFRSLTNRFLIGDTTLTADQKATVYYGHAFTPQYAPQKEYKELDNAYNSGSYGTALVLAEQGLAENPVSLDLTIRALVSATQIPGIAPAKIAALRSRYNLIGDAILCSGSGITPESPFKVITADDEARVLRNLLQVKEIIDRTTIQGMDAVKVRLDGAEDPIILYFDITPARTAAN